MNDTATADQEAAARRDLQHRLRAVLPGAPRITVDSSADPLYRRAADALDAATDPGHPERRCPHVYGIRPYALDMWRGLLSCGQCRHPSQLHLLPGDEEHACDRCRTQVSPADEHRAILTLAGFITTVAMLCPACWRVYVQGPDEGTSP
jgi:hypothetical protein